MIFAMNHLSTYEVQKQNVGLITDDGGTEVDLDSPEKESETKQEEEKGEKETKPEPKSTAAETPPPEVGVTTTSTSTTATKSAAAKVATMTEEEVRHHNQITLFQSSMFVMFKVNDYFGNILVTRAFFVKNSNT